MGHESEQLLATFRIGESWYGVDTVRVQEVILPNRHTPVHGAPEYVQGIINLRGKIVTIMDLGRRIGVGSVHHSDETRILIIPWKEEQIGLLVDEISEVVSPDEERMGPPPANVDESQDRFFTGVYQEGERVVTLLELDTILAAEAVK